MTERRKFLEAVQQMIDTSYAGVEEVLYDIEIFGERVVLEASNLQDAAEHAEMLFAEFCASNSFPHAKDDYRIIYFTATRDDIGCMKMEVEYKKI